MGCVVVLFAERGERAFARMYRKRRVERVWNLARLPDYLAGGFFVFRGKQAEYGLIPLGGRLKPIEPTVAGGGS